jgi:GH25 family lysozyme M1 (1,4-beta-N-acetylmuramidase)
LSPAARRSRHSSLTALLATSFLSAILVFAVAAVSLPGDVRAATTTTALCRVYLRATPSTSARARTVIDAGMKVSVVSTVTGGAWRATCAGKSVSGKTWYKISSANGKTMQSLFGVSYVYAATGMFKPLPPPPVTKYAACRANLRSSASTSATARTVINTDTKVLVVTQVTGSSYSTTCAGKAVSGKSWYRISAVNGKSVKSVYGVSYLYSATGLYKSTVTTTQAPTPSPTPPAATPTPTPAPTPTPTPSSPYTEGIDISHWQGPINWTKVAAAGKRFAFMKASESTDFVDNTYVTNRAQARAVGLYVGAYHFAQPSTGSGDAVAEADHFIDTAQPASGDLIPVLDLERSGSLSQTALTAWVKAFLGRVYERVGVRAAIYVSPNFWRTYMGDTNWFGANGYDILWVAHWTTGTAPTVPGGNWAGDGWTFWQYTSDGAVDGISGRVDLNRYRGTNFTPVLIP